ncbi:MAG: holo-ACP synthase [candidate division KSB1 bacterium]|jgi:holo-[acyl-carrier protein] synthase|nr:holo-ACP synthase [candidate division KSB1 bacterium]
MITGIGTDIVSIKKIESLIVTYKQRFIQKIYTKAEQKYCEARVDRFQHYAVRFAAKEALLKSLGTGLRNGIKWKDMEFLNDDLGKPCLIHHGAVSNMIHTRGIRHIHITFSHAEDMAIAFIVLED